MGNNSSQTWNCGKQVQVIHKLTCGQPWSLLHTIVIVAISPYPLAIPPMSVCIVMPLCAAIIIVPLCATIVIVPLCAAVVIVHGVCALQG